MSGLDEEMLKKALNALKKCGFSSNFFHPNGAPQGIKPAGQEEQNAKLNEWIKHFFVSVGATKDKGNVFCGVVLGRYGKGKSTFLEYIRNSLKDSEIIDKLVIGYLTASDSTKKGRWKFSELIIDILKEANKNKTLSDEEYDKLCTFQEENQDIKNTINYGLEELEIGGYILLFDELEEVLKEVSKDDLKMEEYLADIRSLIDKGGKTLLIFSCTPTVWDIISGPSDEENLFGYLKTRIGDKMIELPDFTADIAYQYIENALMDDEFTIQPKSSLENPFSFKAIRSLILASNYSGRFFNELAYEIFNNACINGIENKCDKIDFEYVLKSLEKHPKYFNFNLLKFISKKISGFFSDEKQSVVLRILTLMIGEFGEYTLENISERLNIERDVVKKIIDILTKRKINDLDGTPLINEVKEINFEEFKSFEDLKDISPPDCLDLFKEDDDGIVFLDSKDLTFTKFKKKLDDGCGKYFLPEISRNTISLQSFLDCNEEVAEKVDNLFSDLKLEVNTYYRLSEPFYIRLFKLGLKDLEIDFGFVKNLEIQRECRKLYEELDEKQKYEKLLDGFTYCIKELNSELSIRFKLAVSKLEDNKLSLELKDEELDDFNFTVSVLFHIQETDITILNEKLQNFKKEELFNEDTEVKLGIVVYSGELSEIEHLGIYQSDVDIVNLPLRNFLKFNHIFQKTLDQLIMISYIEELDIDEESIDDKKFTDVKNNVFLLLYRPITTLCREYIDIDAKLLGLRIDESYHWNILSSTYLKDFLDSKEYLEMYYLNEDLDINVDKFEFKGGDLIRELTSKKLLPFMEINDSNLRIYTPKEEITLLKIIYNLSKEDLDNWVTIEQISIYFSSKQDEIELQNSLRIYIHDLLKKKFLESDEGDKDNFFFKDFRVSFKVFRDKFNLIKPETIKTELKAKIDDSCDQNTCVSRPWKFWENLNKDNNKLDALTNQKVKLIDRSINFLPEIGINETFFEESEILFNEKLDSMFEFENIEKYITIWPKILWQIKQIEDILDEINDLKQKSQNLCSQYCEIFNDLLKEEEEKGEMEGEEEEDWDIEIEGFSTWEEIIEGDENGA